MAISTKTNWTDGETVFAADINRIENNSKELKTEVDLKVTRSADTTLTGVMTFQGADRVKIRRSINGVWYEGRPVVHQMLIGSENCVGMVFNRVNDLARFGFNQHGLVLEDLVNSKKHTIIHTGNLDLIAGVAPAALED